MLVDGRYRLLEEAGRGSFSAVARAVDEHTGELVALKLQQSDAHEAMLWAELRQLQRLRHPALPRVLAIGRTTEPWRELPAGSLYLVAEWIGGSTLASLMRGPAPPPEVATRRVLTVLRDVGGALAALHAAGLVHRDVAPSNIRLDERGERAHLLDLGLVEEVGVHAGGAHGTLPYLAPEALVGRAEPRSDLYGLGACVVALATGEPPFAAWTRGASPSDELPRMLEAILRTGAPPTLPGLPTPLSGLVARLLARDPTRRPSSAAALLEELSHVASAAPGATARQPPAPAPPPPPLPLVGRRELVRDLAAELAHPGLTLLIGGHAAGGAAVAEAALAEATTRALLAGRAMPPRITGSLDDVARQMAPASSDSTPLALPAVLAACQTRADEVVPTSPRLCAVLDLIDDERALPTCRALWRPGLAAAVVALIDDDTAAALALDAPTAGWDAPITARRLAPLTRELLAELARELGFELTPAALDELLRQSAGEPALAAALLRADGSGAPSADHRELWTRRLSAAPSAVVGLVTALALWPGEVALGLALATLDDPEVGLADVAAAEALGLVRRVRGAERLAVAPGLGALALARLTEPDRHALANRALAAAAQLGAPALIAAAPMLQLPVSEVGAERLLATARALAAGGAPASAQALLDHLESGLDASAPDARRAPELATLRAELALARGDYPAALAASERAGTRAARLIAARTHQRRGELAQAERLLSDLLAEPGPGGDSGDSVASEAAATLARVLLGRGQLEEAAALARVHAPRGGELGPELTEVLGLVAFYRGQLEEADRQFAAAESAATAAGRAVAIGRAQSLRGMVAQQRGQLALASERYAVAAQRLAAAGQAHAAATCDLNLGTALAERGRHAEALAHTSAAGRVFLGLGAGGDWVAAEVNRANSLVALGQHTAARELVAVALAHPAASPHLAAFGQLVLAEAARREGDHAAARAIAEQVAAAAAARGDAHATISAQLALAEAGGGLPRDELLALATSDDDRQRVELAVARRLGLQRALAPALVAAAAAAHEVAQRALAADRQERAFRAFAVAACSAAAAGEPTARAWAGRARAAHAAWLALTPPTFADALARDPDLSGLPATETTSPAPGAPAAAEHAAARRLLALSLRLNSEVTLPRILDEVIDTAIELARAERGFLLLREPDGQLAPMVARNFPAAERASDPGAEQVSRSIAERAARTGEPVLTIDAGLDARFDSASSVAALRLRSVLAVPLRQRGAVIGCIYVDHRLRRGAFDDDAAAVLGELADIAAIAIANAQLTAELRRRNDEIDRLNRSLSTELAERDAELARVRATEARPLRGRYEAITGASPAMRHMLALVDRAAGTSYPVVIVGESGTGKELVARALHASSPRKDRPFVAVNCSALPDALLESELFGHVRGAFTGADRDRRGMFEVAHGGTLFLDEIGDTSAAMQARLLRVLQEGEVRRLGDSATTKVDVRVLAACQRPLAELVAAGRFRDDLRFRLEVLAIAVPPLRERAGDLPLLVEHLLRRLGAEAAPPRPPPRLSRAAMRALAQHRWPGNVRELANVLAHGLAMAGDDAEVIELGDLPAALTSGAAPARTAGAAPPSPGADLRLRPALRATERAYLRAALERTGGNQTAAARLLGLSRFGLQKKLRREHEDDADDEDAT